MRSRGVTSVGLMAMGVTLLFLFSGAARAQEQSGVQPAPTPAAQALVDKIVQMNKKALDDYDTLEWDSAKRTLLEALVAGKKGGLDSHPVMARTYLHLGCVYITGLEDRPEGRAELRARHRDRSDDQDRAADDGRRARGGVRRGGEAGQAAPRRRCARRGGADARSREARAAQAEGPRHGG